MKMTRVFFSLCLLLVSLLAIYPTTALAQDREPLKEGEERIHLEATYPKLETISGQSFEFQVELSYLTYLGQGEATLFELGATVPEGWSVYMTPRFEKEKRISAIRLEPLTTTPETVLVTVTSPIWPLSEPGEYKITLEAIAGETKDTVELTAEITARYAMFVVPTAGLYNTTAKAGEDNFFAIEVQNLGTAPIDNVNFSSDKPSGWTVEFTPKKIDSLPAIERQTVDINIKPPAKTVAGDYQIQVTAAGNQEREQIQIRVTVETPTIWGWVGVGIIALVIAGLAYIFMRFSRR